MLDLESILIVWLCAAAFLPVVIWVRRRASRSAGMSALFLWAGFSLAVGVGASRNRPETFSESEVEDRPVELATDGYLSSRTCQACHPDAYHSWHSSYHRSMTQLPTSETVIGDFDNATVTFHGRSYRLQREGDEYWAEYDDPEAGKRFALDARVRRKIKLLTGSHHMQVYWVSPGDGRKLDMLPIVWLKEADRWIPRSASFIQPPTSRPDAESGRWNASCLICHATQEQPRWESAEVMDTRVGEFGIACEACHGPGEEHVRIHSSPLTRYSGRLAGKLDDPMVQPEKLDKGRASDVCGQCHSISTEITPEEHDRWRRRGKSFRPGDVLRETMIPVALTNRAFTHVLFGGDKDKEQGSYWSDGMVRVAGREFNGLLETPCHVHGEGERKMTCFSCHELHPDKDSGRDLAEWADDQLKPGMRGNAACLQCHEDYRSGLEGHTRHAADSAGSLCYNCHMPHTTYGLLKATRSHRLESPSVAASIATGRPNACNQCHLDRTLAWTAERLEEWYGIESPAVSGDEVDIPASALWALRGDAGQRALAAWSFGWEAALGISGSNWVAPILATLAADPYEAVRYIALRSLKRTPGFSEFDADHLQPEEEMAAVAERIVEIWREKNPEATVDDRLILRRDTLTRLLKSRDNRPVVIAE